MNLGVFARREDLQVKVNRLFVQMSLRAQLRHTRKVCSQTYLYGLFGSYLVSE